MSCLREFLRPGSEQSTAKFALEGDGRFIGPLDSLPRNRGEVYAIFGDPGATKKNSKEHQRKRMSVARGLPGRWNDGRTKLFCHSLAEPYLREALRVADRSGALSSVRRIGCYTHRHQRHDPHRPLSYHSWGIAVDIDPALNRARKFGDGLRPAEFSDEWKSWWPYGVSEKLVAAFEGAGWSWGGRWNRLVDPMHFELISR